MSTIQLQQADGCAQLAQEDAANNRAHQDQLLGVHNAMFGQGVYMPPDLRGVFPAQKAGTHSESVAVPRRVKGAAQVN